MQIRSRLLEEDEGDYIEARSISWSRYIRLAAKSRDSQVSQDLDAAAAGT